MHSIGQSSQPVFTDLFLSRWCHADLNSQPIEYANRAGDESGSRLDRPVRAEFENYAYFVQMRSMWIWINLVAVTVRFSLFSS